MLIRTREIPLFALVLSLYLVLQFIPIPGDFPADLIFIGMSFGLFSMRTRLLMLAMIFSFEAPTFIITYHGLPLVLEGAFKCADSITKIIERVAPSPSTNASKSADSITKIIERVAPSPSTNASQAFNHLPADLRAKFMCAAGVLGLVVGVVALCYILLIGVLYGLPLLAALVTTILIGGLELSAFIQDVANCMGADGLDMARFKDVLGPYAPIFIVAYILSFTLYVPFITHFVMERINFYDRIPKISCMRSVVG